MKLVSLPSITVSAMDFDRLMGLATAAMHSRRYTIAEMLADELERVMIAVPDTIRPDVVTMHSQVEYRDNITGDVRRIILVYPGQEDLGPGRISVLTHIGAALIGLSEGQSVEWLGPMGGWYGLTVRRVHFQLERVAGLSA